MSSQKPKNMPSKHLSATVLPTDICNVVGLYSSREVMDNFDFISDIQEVLLSSISLLMA